MYTFHSDLCSSVWVISMRKSRASSPAACQRAGSQVIAKPLELVDLPQREGLEDAEHHRGKPSAPLGARAVVTLAAHHRSPQDTLAQKEPAVLQDSTRRCRRSLYMSLIHTCALNGADPFDYLTMLEKHHSELNTNPKRWMPWNYRESYDDGGLCGGRAHGRAACAELIQLRTLTEGTRLSCFRSVVRCFQFA